MNGTEHQSLTGGSHPDEWRPGVTCPECQELDLARRSKLFQGSPTMVLFHGWSSLNPKMGEFLATGDPEVWAPDRPRKRQDD